MKRRVANIRCSHRGEALTIAGTLIDRTTIYGNHKFYIGRDGSREEVVRKHNVDFLERIKTDPAFKVEVEKLRNEMTLLCWCAPLPCHGDNIIRYLEATDERPHTDTKDNEETTSGVEDIPSS